MGWMTQFAVRGPGPKLNLGDERRLDPDDVCLSGIGNRRLLSLPGQLIQYLLQPDRLGLPEARADAPDMGSEQEQSEIVR